ncbi:MAG TPA: PD-(D/E)XK nuclease family protein [Candidatus Krumholzibacteria bacterium]|nr:PD-(D/E)XK nuclease family protein [Candidatus Krumholzibacteria bacterium]
MHFDDRIHEFLQRRPGHACVSGPPGSGKTTLLVERWRALVARGHRPGIVAFGREQRARLLERVIAPGGAYLGAYPVTTHALVASALLADPQSRPLREVDEMLVLGRLLRRESGLLSSDLAAISDSPTFLRDLLHAVHALAQHGIAVDDARACIHDGVSDRVCDVLRVYARYREVCDARGLATFYDAAWRAAARFGAGGVRSPLDEFDVVLVDDFHDLDPGQYHLLTRLVPPDGARVLEVFGDTAGARFAFRGTSDRFFTESFPSDYRPAQLELAAPACDDAALRATVVALVSGTASRASGSIAAPALDLPLFAGAPSASAVATARPAWACSVSLRLADDEIAEAQMVAVRARAAIDAGVAPREIAVVARDVERYRSILQLACHEWGVPVDTGGDGDSAADGFLYALLGALGSDGDGRFTEALAVSPYAGFLGDAVATIQRAYASRDGFDLERLIRERITPYLEPGDEGARTTLVSVGDEWRRYNEVVLHVGGGPSLDEFRATYLVAREKTATAGNRVALLSAREVTGRSFHTAFVCGAADGFFPGGTVREGYIPFAILARAVARVNADAARDIAARVDETAAERAENALFLSAITRATHALTISVPSRIGGESTSPSTVLAVEERPFSVESASRVESPCAHAARAVAETEPSAARAERVRKLDTLAAWWLTPPRAARFPALASFSMSASKLNSYARCPRQFFYRSILRLEEPESIYLRVGNLVHEALKEIIPPGATGDEVRTALRAAGTREIAERLVAAGMPEAGAWMRALSVHYLQDMLQRVAELEATREGEYRVRMLEESIEAVIEGMPIRGRVDRVDDVEGLGPLVIDYKTSGSIKKTYPTLVDKMQTEYWQIPVYAAMTAVNGIAAAGFVYYALPPGEESFAAGVQLVPGDRPAPVPLGRRPYRYGPVDTRTVAGAMAQAVEIHRTIVEGECEYERTENRQICPNCHFARICQRSRASI